MASRAAELVAEIIDGIEGRPYGTGRPPLPTIEVVETLRFFVREGVQWQELRAAPGAPAAPPCAVAWTSGAPRPCCAGSTWP